MRGFWIAMTAAAGAAMLAATPASAATVLNVDWNSDCGKSTCFNDKGVFTQTWSSAGAHGPTTIGQFLMDRGVLGALDDKTFRSASRWEARSSAPGAPTTWPASAVTS